MKYTREEYITTAHRLHDGDSIDIDSNAEIHERDGKGGIRLQVWVWIDDYEVAETKTRTT